MNFTFDRSKHVFYSPEFEELIKDSLIGNVGMGFDTSGANLGNQMHAIL